MDPINFGYSTKNIPLPSEKDYKRKLIEKTEHLCKRMRWKAFFFLNPDASRKDKETYGFHSSKTAPQVPELQLFESKLLEMISNIKFTKSKNGFQKQLSSDIHRKVKNTNKLVISADKSTNFYNMDKKDYQDLLLKNITKTYKKVDREAVNDINKEAKHIAEQLELDDRIEILADKKAFITLKDHKPNFANNPTCRLINPAKSEIGNISKQILDRINSKIVSNNKLNQWKNTSSVLKWFNNIANKDQYKFIIFDVVEFYPSISIELLNAALDFAEKHDNITARERDIIIHAKKSCLFNAEDQWGKKASPDLYDITMGSFDGAESCELVGSFLLSIITKKHGDKYGLYRDDGLGLVRATSRQVENVKKDLCATFHKYGLKITIDANKKIVNFLDVTLNLTTGKHSPYAKPNNVPIYVHSKSNHPPNIIKNIPESINRRLSEISSDSETFHQAIAPYQQALDKSGYTFKLHYSPATPAQPNTSRKRKRNTTWYNPPYSTNVSTNIGHQFLKLLDTQFPKGHLLHKLFNRANTKVSYSCMGNIKQVIDGHNKSILSKNTSDNISNNMPRECNCRAPNNCPLSGHCLSKSAIYQATVSTADDQPDKHYVGLTQNTFKTRYANHTASFRHINKRCDTELSKHVWKLKEKNINFNIKWRILKHASAYSNETKRCQLCNWEKYFIIFHPNMASLNKRNELLSTCRHASRFLLKNFTVT